MLFLLILASFAASGYAEVLCFSDSVPASRRQYIQNEEGVAIPIKIGSFRWNLAVQVSVLADLLISEKLGYHVAPVEFLGFPSFQDLVLKLAGCTSTLCNETADAVHIVVDSFAEDAVTMESFRAAQPERVFSWGIYVTGSVRDAAFREAGLPLEYYRNYVTGFNRPHRFFHSLSDLDGEDFLLCNDSTTYGDDFTNARLWANYVQWTGDTDGVIETSGGYVAKCPDGRFWLSPACRGNSSECIPVLSAFATLANMLQWATVHSLPFAIGRPPNFPKFLDLARTYDVLFYYWEPDDTLALADLQVSRLVLPPNNVAEYKEGNFRTAAAGTNLYKYGSSLLARFAPRVRGLVQGIATNEAAIWNLATSISMGQGQELGDVFFTNQSEARRQMCEWAKSNLDVWEPWLPIETNCILGFGLVNAEDDHVASREEATRCSLCPAGTFSQFFVDDVGHTHRCTPCPPGTSQSASGKATCGACGLGTFASNPGQALCSPCARGSYAASLGMSSCFKCGDDTERTTTVLAEEGWVVVQGATSSSYCRCAPGRFLRNGQCLPCGVGASCPGSDSLEVLPGFHAKALEPGLIFKCFGLPGRCPGGLPGTCAPGRDAGSPGCSECLEGLQPNGAECAPCSAGDYVRLAAYGLLVLFATAGLHLLFLVGGHGSNRLQSKVVTAALCSSHLITYAQLYAVMSQIQAVNWAEPFLSFLELFKVLSLETMLSSVWSISCITSLTPEANFLTRTLLVPLFFTLGPIISHVAFTRMAKKSLGMPATQQAPKVAWLSGSLGSLCLLFFIMMCFVCLEPFRCNVHPNGLATMQTEHGVFCNFFEQHLRLCIVGGVVMLIPLGFLGLSTWIVTKELPRRVAKGDTEFVRATSFLTMRFKPGYEAFSVAFLLRNLLLAVTPMFSSASVSLLMMGSLLTTSVAMVAYFKPWRSLLTSQVDILGHLVMLVVLLLSGLSVQDQNDSSVMVFCTAISSFMVAVILAAAVHSVAQYVKSKFHKPFSFFLCHHKAVTASLARWLKMELQGRGSHFTTFLDLDSLTDLTLLFSYVSTQVRTFVILGSPGVVARKWCLGEMATARLSNVTSVLVSLPDFKLPDEIFIKQIATRVPDILDLTTYGYGVSEVKATLRWLASLKLIAMEKVSAVSVGQMVGELTGRGVKSNNAVLRSEGACIVVDHEHPEAFASAHVLQRLLAPIMMDRGMPIMVLPLENPQTQLEYIQPYFMVLMCSRNCFASPYIKECVLKARFLQACAVLPVISDEDFVLHASAPVVATDCEDGEAYQSVLAAVFLEVALPFHTRSSSEEDLAIRALHIGRRLVLGAFQTLRSKLWMTSGRPESDDESSMGESPAQGQLHGRLDAYLAEEEDMVTLKF
ncbi:SCUBE3 [Symbiodinium natans]|uniref:SCUBE3 protein n=1 Tax=Symbiodinium natans TaxID=878477 RepID=A0A812QA99_9DINO|nr:SCUBE3 [Symbiodinium natans]